jgi:hypothetical protein
MFQMNVADLHVLCSSRYGLQTNGGTYWTFGCHKMRAGFQLATWLSASLESPCSMQLISSLMPHKNSDTIISQKFLTRNSVSSPFALPLLVFIPLFPSTSQLCLIQLSTYRLHYIRPTTTYSPWRWQTALFVGGWIIFIIQCGSFS